VSPRVGVVGATGVLGRHVVPRLMERGYQPRALVRNAPAARGLESLGAEIVRGDILDADTLPPLVDGLDVVLHLATAVPRPGQGSDFAMNDRVRREGTRNLLAACESAAVRRYLQQSIAMLQGASGGAWTDESASPSLTPITQSAWDMEQMVRRSRLDWLIIRGALFYGPGTGLDAAWREAARQGRLTTPGDGQRFASLLHVTDMAEAVVRGIEGPSALVLAAADDRPMRYAELFDYIATIEGGAPAKRGGPERLASFRVPNHRIRSALGWAPHYRSVLSGLA
jgi:nucleoside-diphosphate-sugar epimerase